MEDLLRMLGLDPEQHQVHVLDMNGLAAIAASGTMSMGLSSLKEAAEDFALVQKVVTAVPDIGERIGIDGERLRRTVVSTYNLQINLIASSIRSLEPRGDNRDAIRSELQKSAQAHMDELKTARDMFLD